MQTLSGSIAADQLGTTLMHEHIFVGDPEVRLNYGDGWWDEAKRIDDAAAKLTAAHARGITSIVEMTVLGIGRDVRLLAAVNDRTPMNIIASTGLYTFDALPRLFRNEGPGRSVDRTEPMTEWFLRDIEIGMAGTTMRAGMIKSVWETPDLSATALRVHEAICQTHRLTGTPMTVHTNAANRSGTNAVDYYAREGVDLSRMIVGHAGDSTNLTYLRSITDRGATVGFDRFGLDTYASTDTRVSTLAALCKDGLADRIILSQDSAAFTESWATPAARAAQERELPNWHYTYLVDDVLDQMRRSGITEEQIHTMMVENPSQMLATN